MPRLVFGEGPIPCDYMIVGGSRCRYCDRRAVARGMCAAHYQRARKGRSIEGPIGLRLSRSHDTCLYCSRHVKALGLCDLHWQRWYYCVPMETGRRRKKWIDRRGYRWIWSGGREILEHRYVVEQALGRRLRTDEVVHHKDGNKLDNRIENLEVLSNSEHVSLHRRRLCCAS